MTNINDVTTLEGIIGIIPEYDRHGDNVCRIISSDGESEVVSDSVVKFLDKCLFTYGLSIHGQRTWARRITGHENLNPILINKDIVLLPVKVRTSLGPADECYGYVAFDSICEYSAGKLILHNDVAVPCLTSQLSIRNKIKDCRLLRYIHIDEIRSRYDSY